MRIFLGFDPRSTEQEAYEVAARSAESFGCDVSPLYEDRLRASGMLTRPTDRRGDAIWDLNSNASCSTEFAISRFFVPLLAHSGWALFADCDVMFMQDPRRLLIGADKRKAVHVVKHAAKVREGVKMDGRAQVAYHRKLWSSVVLWSCDHPANRRLNLTTLNQLPGRDLHAFSWLADDEIGELDASWNHLVGIDEPRTDARLVHFTSGTPNMRGYENCEYADEWRRVRAA